MCVPFLQTFDVLKATGRHSLRSLVPAGARIERCHRCAESRGVFAQILSMDLTFSLVVRVAVSIAEMVAGGDHFSS
jgi:hypothetical protein